MDLKTLAPTSNEVVVELKHPVTGEVLMIEGEGPMTVTLHATHTKEYREAMFDQTDAIMQNAGGDQGYKVKANDMAKLSFELLVKVTKDWNIYLDGKKPKFSKKAAAKLYEELFWLPQQLEKELSEHTPFT